MSLWIAPPAPVQLGTAIMLLCLKPTFIKVNKAATTGCPWKLDDTLYHLNEHALFKTQFCVAGSIPATGRVKDKLPTSVTMSAANSLQFNQLIGGGISPSVISQQNGSSNNGGCNSSSATSQVMSPTSQHQQVNSNLMIGDYVHGNMSNVLTSPYRQH